MDAGNLISGSSAFYKSSLKIWKCSVHILLKPTVHVLLKTSWNGSLIPDVLLDIIFQEEETDSKQSKELHCILDKDCAGE